MERNLRRMANYCAQYGLNLRPHTKTHKIPALAHKQVELGAVGITVAKTGEAEVMANAGLEDILIACPVFGEQKWQRVVSLAERVRLSVAIDSLEAARNLSVRAQAQGTTVGILVEFDTGFGRCGLPIDQQSVSVTQQIAELPGLILRGVMTYPGHFFTGRQERNGLLDAEIEKIQRLMDLLQSAGIATPIFSGGSTPSAHLAHRFPVINEIRPGTYIFNDKNQVSCEIATYEDCAACVLTTVVSTSVPGRTIVDGGSKTFSSETLVSGDRKGFGHVLDDPGILFDHLSEEHGHLDITNATKRFKMGDRLRIIPNHICVCVNLHDRIYGVRGDEVVTEWRVVGRGKIT